MKTIPIALADHLVQETTTTCICLQVVRTDAEVFGFTSLDQKIFVDGIVYEPGFDVSAITSAEGLDVDNLELTVLSYDEQVTAIDLQTGVWNGAEFTVFEVNYLDVDAGVNVLKRGTAGEAKLFNGKYVLEFRGIKQALQQPQGIQTQKTCRARFGDAKCTIDLTPYTFEGNVVLTVTDRQRFSDGIFSGATQFTNGLVIFTSGENSGYQRRVRSYDSGEYTTDLPFPFDIEVGDEFTAIVGCQKRLTEDCKDRFNNVLNFQGEPHLPGVDHLTAKEGTSSEEDDA